MGNGSFKLRLLGQSQENLKKSNGNNNSTSEGHCTAQKRHCEIHGATEQQNTGINHPNHSVCLGNNKENLATSMLELYNLMVMETWQGLPRISEPYYILLLDYRGKPAYDAYHIITATHRSFLQCEGGILQPHQMKNFQMVILCGSDDEYPVQNASNKLTENGVEHYILDCSVDLFLVKYPFLTCREPCSSMGMKHMVVQIMPSEIIGGFLYQGNAKHAADPHVISSLGITHIINATLERPNAFAETVRYLRIPLADMPTEDILSWLRKTCEFINSAHREASLKADSRNNAVLVHCNLGRSRSSTIVLAYLMSAKRMSLLEASNLLKSCRPTVMPNVGFLEQLLKFEEQTLGTKSELNELPF